MRAANGFALIVAVVLWPWVLYFLVPAAILCFAASLVFNKP